MNKVATMPTRSRACWSPASATSFWAMTDLEWKWRSALPGVNFRPKCVSLDFGIRGFDLAYALQDGYETTILIDAFPHGQAPGTVYVVEPDLNDLDASSQPGELRRTPRA